MQINHNKNQYSFSVLYNSLLLRGCRISLAKDKVPLLGAGSIPENLINVKNIKLLKKTLLINLKDDRVMGKHQHYCAYY